MQNPKFHSAMRAYVKATQDRDSLYAKVLTEGRVEKIPAVVAGTNANLECLVNNSLFQEQRTAAHHLWMTEVSSVAAASYYLSAYMALTLTDENHIHDTEIKNIVDDVRDELESVIDSYLVDTKSILAKIQEQSNVSIVDLGNTFMRDFKVAVFESEYM